MPYASPEKRKQFYKEYQKKNAAHLAEYRHRYRGQNRERLKEQKAAWYQEHAGHVLEKSRAWRVENPEKRRQTSREYEQRRRCEDVGYRLKGNLRHRVWQALQGAGKSKATMELVGCSIVELKAWLSGWFEPGMSWENYGEWHVDHVRPCVTFDLTCPKQQQKCFHYLNLRPLWAEDNLRKWAKYVMP